MPPPVLFGVDHLCNHARRRRWRRVGLVTNEAARLAEDPGERSRVRLREAGVPLVRLFGPEHGLAAAADDGAAVADGVDPATGLPVVSLYGDRMRPSTDQLDDLDVVLFDVPDVGARFYTYAWTLWHLLHAGAEAGVPVVVLDRPNPLGGVIGAAEGPLLHADCRSFIGEDDIPIRHACTLGELARLWHREHLPALELDVVACTGWDATRAWPATGRPWVPTSPAMPTFDCAIWYPGTCLFEATNVSVGRGTGAPFATIGAPWLDAAALREAVEPLVPGVTLTPADFVPATGPYAGVTCRGVRLALAGAAATGGQSEAALVVARELRPVHLGLRLLAAIIDRHRDRFEWARYPTAANPRGDTHLARLLGRAEAAHRFSTARPPVLAAAISDWTRAPGWAARVQDILLYPRDLAP